MVTQGNNHDKARQTRKPPIRSPYLFPAYDLGVALRIAERVERDGGGNLTEETLAVILGVSVKSSGFRLRGLTARQFGLLAKQGGRLITTPIAQAIFKPRSEQEKADGLRESFMKIPLFRAVATKYRGQPLPQGEAFRNILEREFGIENNRVAAAERVLMDSAREAGLLQSSGGKVYLTTETVQPGGPSPVVQTVAPEDVFRGEVAPYEAPSGRGFLTISEEDLAQFSDKEFHDIWRTLGNIVRARSKREYAGENRIAEGESETELGDLEADEGDHA